MSPILCKGLNEEHTNNYKWVLNKRSPIRNDLLVFLPIGPS